MSFQFTKILGVLLLFGMAIAGASLTNQPGDLTVPTEFQSAIRAARTAAHNGGATLLMTASANGHTSITVTDAAGNIQPFLLDGQVKIQGASSATISVTENGSATISGSPGIASVSVSAPGHNMTLYLQPIAVQ